MLIEVSGALHKGLGRSVLKSNDIVAGLHGGDALADRLDDTSTLVTEDDGESTFRVLSGESVGVYDCQFPPGQRGSGGDEPVWQTPVW